MTCALCAAACGASDAPDAPNSMLDGGTEWVLEPLSAAEGFTIKVPPFEVPPGHEEQSCYFLEVPDLDSGSPLWVNRVVVGMNPGSHHMNVFRVRTLDELRPEDGEPIELGEYSATVVRGHDDYAGSPCWQSANWADWPLVANTQHAEPGNPITDWTLPEGVAMRFEPGELLMIQSHYVNTSLQPTAKDEGRVSINFHRSPEPAPVELGTLFATQQNIRVCRSTERAEYSGTCKFPGAVTITAANGHFHSRGQRFEMYAWDGKSLDHPAGDDRFYLSDEWDHPEMATGIDRRVADGGGIWWDCAFEWHQPASGCAAVDAKDPERQGDCCYTFGGNTDVGEHCNVFLYYYPRVDGTDVFCN